MLNKLKLLTVTTPELTQHFGIPAAFVDRVMGVYIEERNCIVIHNEKCRTASAFKETVRHEIVHAIWRNRYRRTQLSSIPLRMLFPLEEFCAMYYEKKAQRNFWRSWKNAYEGSWYNVRILFGVRFQKRQDEIFLLRLKHQSYWRLEFLLEMYRTS